MQRRWATAGAERVLTLSGSAAATVTLGNNGSLAAGTYSGNLIVNGGTGANTITGGSGTNTIIGGGGADTLNGGSGADYFVFRNTSNSTLWAKDLINNFVHGADFIDTSIISGITAIQGLISGSGQIAAHSVAWVQSGADTLVYFNSSGVAENQSCGRHGRCAQVNCSQRAYRK